MPSNDYFKLECDSLRKLNESTHEALETARNLYRAVSKSESGGEKGQGRAE